MTFKQDFIENYQDNMDRDPVYKDYELADYRFIVVNKKTLTPLVWKFEDTKRLALTYGKDNRLNSKTHLTWERAQYIPLLRPEVPAE